MISIIESEPDFQTRSKFKGNQSSFWRKLARELNALGPPSRDPTAWKKAWIDYKFGARKRLAQREKQIASGAVPRPLTSLERKLSHLLDIDIMKITTLEENQSYVDNGKRSKADYFEKVLDVNRSLVAATNMSLNLQNELITELRGMKQSNEQIIASCAEVNANLKSMTATLQELVAVLKSK
ncbi:uncharacterized protein LOC128724966 [Anopheles nili]|uniref:uncharacterized protein LOC128724966 n=1 Tax=Anopheles nili TaxID=185578 RepID=UPI00237B0558|nr:uncharacterized protein LOC128724966 [Anopheles nili]